MCVAIDLYMGDDHTPPHYQNKCEVEGKIPRVPSDDTKLHQSTRGDATARVI